MNVKRMSKRLHDRRQLGATLQPHEAGTQLIGLQRRRLDEAETKSIGTDSGYPTNGGNSSC
jgi:hypothetical protein